MLFREGHTQLMLIFRPTYPTPLSPAEINSALVMPYTAYTIMGKGGVVAVLLMVFQAITSAMSSGENSSWRRNHQGLTGVETVAVTSLVTYDFYRSYINPEATGERLVFISHIAVVSFGLLTACVAVGLTYAGFSVTFIVTAIGILIDGMSSQNVDFTLLMHDRCRNPQRLYAVLEKAEQVCHCVSADHQLTGKYFDLDRRSIP